MVDLLVVMKVAYLVAYLESDLVDLKETGSENLKVEKLEVKSALNLVVLLEIMLV